MTAHPSMLELDAFALGAGRAEVATHVEGCTRCAAHVARVQQQLPVPAWVREVEASRGRARHPAWIFRSSVLVAVALFALGTFFVRMKHRGPDEPDRGVKGMPSVAVYIKHEGVVSLWDGEGPVHAGDAVQLKVASGGYPRVTVAAVQGGTLTELYAGSAAGEALLPRSWMVDEEVGPEVLLVAFSRSPLTKTGQEAALATLPRTRDIWATRLQLSKTGGGR